MIYINIVRTDTVAVHAQAILAIDKHALFDN